MKDELLLRLESFEIDKPGVAFPFNARLARDNGWTRGYSRHVVREYFRFVWLAMRAGHPVTPSAAVDEAWHLHLCYTRSYWDGMCSSLLGKPLHHGSTEGGESEDAKFGDWYEKTLESYRKHFGEPPADIWPSSAERFAPVLERKVDPRTHWIISKRSTLRWAIIGPAVVALPVLAGCTPLIAEIEPGGLLCVGLIFFAVFILTKTVNALGYGNGKKNDKNSSGCGSGCSSISGGCGSSSSHHHSDGNSGSANDSSDGGSSGCGSSGCGGGGD